MSWQRETVWAGEQGQSTKFLYAQRHSAESLFSFQQAAFGSSNSQFFGLSCAPITGVLQVSIGTGSVYQYLAIDPTVWSTLPAQTNPYLLQGLVVASQTITGFSAPATSGYSQNFLVECQIQVTDTAAVSTPYYNSSNPAQPIYQQSSPSRENLVVFKVKAGTAAPTGTQTTPSADSGYVPLYSVQVNNGQTSIPSGQISLASGAPAFYGFVPVNPLGNTPVYLNPASPQLGSVNISGTATISGMLLGGATAFSGFKTAFLSGLAGDYGKFTAIGWTGSAQSTDSVNISGSIGYIGPHAGTDVDPYPISQLNVAMLGGKLASDYALAAGNYITVYAGTPTLASGNAGITGQFTANAPQGTAPLIVQSTTQVANLNTQYVGGYSPGNASGNIPISNGTLCTNLNAQYLGGQPSSYYQPAGSYAAMNATNTGSFAVTSFLQSTGGTGSTQIQVGYNASNNSGFNNGGPVAYVYAISQPLAIYAPSVRTNGPLYVGDATRQNAYMQDLIPSGMLRAGVCVYTVTYSTSTSYPYPGNGTAWGSYGSVAGHINVGADTASHSAFWINFRCKVTLNASLGVTFQGLGYPTATVRVDGNVVGTIGGTGAGSAPYTFSSGTHTVDITYAAQNMNQPYYLGTEGTQDPYGGSLTVFGWIPLSSGQVSSAITSIVPG